MHQRRGAASGIAAGAGSLLVLVLALLLALAFYRLRGYRAGNAWITAQIVPPGAPAWGRGRGVMQGQPTDAYGLRLGRFAWAIRFGRSGGRRSALH